MIQARLAAALIIAGCAFAGGWLVNGWRLGEQLAGYQRDQAQALADAQQAADAQAAAWQHDVAVMDARYTQDLHDARTQISTLRHQLERGARVVRVAGHCPQAATPTDTTGVDHGATCRLDPAAESTYLDLRSGLQQQRTQLLACQAFIRSACQ